MRAVANETEREFSALSCQSSLSHRQYVVLPVTLGAGQWYAVEISGSGCCCWCLHVLLQ